jgi:hypothetical protein
MDQVVGKRGIHNYPPPMGLIGKPPQKGSLKSILLQRVKGEIHIKVLLALHWIKMK